jgi:hypothetical protein
MRHLKNAHRQRQPSRNTTSINLRKNGLWQEIAQRTDETPLWLQRQKNQACRSNNITRLFWHPQKSRHKIHNLQCCRHAISLQCLFWTGLTEHLKAAMHSAYLYIKIPATFRVITVFRSRKEARNIECVSLQGTRTCIS